MDEVYYSVGDDRNRKEVSNSGEKENNDWQPRPETSRRQMLAIGEYDFFTSRHKMPWLAWHIVHGPLHNERSHVRPLWPLRMVDGWCGDEVVVGFPQRSHVGSEFPAAGESPLSCCLHDVPRPAG